MNAPLKTTQPNWAEGLPDYEFALANKEESLSSWQYNVADHLKPLSQEQIKSYVKENSLPFAVMLEFFAQDFNISSAIRNANALGAREIFYVGIKRFDRRGAQGTTHYSNVRWLSTFDELMELKSKYKFIGIDNIKDSIPIGEHKWEANTMLIFGSEAMGITPMMQSLCEKILYIPQRGSVRSMNCASAAAIAMYDFNSRFVG